jgi:predicted DNA binding CopG/RHH family protein
MATDLRAFWEQERSHYGKLVEELGKERERIESQQISLARKVADAVVPDHLAKQMFEEYESKLRSIEARLSKSSANDREPHINILIDYGKRFFEQVESFWQTADVSDKKRVQNFFFPTGAVVEDRRVPRTASEVPVTGGGCFLFGPCVQFGGPQRQKCEHDELRRRVDFFRDLYSTFGRDS